MKKLLSVVLSAAMIATLGISSFAAVQERSNATSGQEITKVLYSMGTGGFIWSIPDTVDFNNAERDAANLNVVETAQVKIMPANHQHVIRINNGSRLYINYSSEHSTAPFTNSDNKFWMMRDGAVDDDKQAGKALVYKVLGDDGASIPVSGTILDYTRSEINPAGASRDIAFSASLDDIAALEEVGTYGDKITFDLYFFDNDVDHVTNGPGTYHGADPFVGA